MFPRHLSRTAWAVAVLLIGAGGAVLAQIEGGDRGVAAIDSAGSFEVSGIDVDVSAATAEAARLGGWRLAQRKGWAMLAKRLGAAGGSLSDGGLDAIVSGIVVENEQLGPNRYVARLGVLFDRARAGEILGVTGQIMRSPPMLVLPVQISGGAMATFEGRTDWQQAWGRFRTGNSSIDYVRPVGSGPDPLLLNAGQAGRPGRGWWRMLLDQYGASDVLIPEVRLYRQWPGGPIIGVFTARHGPDSQEISHFTLRVGSGNGLEALLDAGVKRIDEAYTLALSRGVLRPDPSLTYEPPVAAAPDEEEEATDAEVEATDTADQPPTASQATISVQVETPSVGAVSASEDALRGVPGVRSAGVSSLALGGTSVIRVVYLGDIAGLRAALEARGWLVQEGGGTLRIRRGLILPDIPSSDNVTGG